MPGESAVTSIAGRRFVRAARMDEVLLPAAPLGRSPFLFGLVGLDINLSDLIPTCLYI
jgi:hypothetical protein